MTFLSNLILKKLTFSLFFIGSSVTILAQELSLMNGVVPKPGDNQKTAIDKYKKKGPWKITSVRLKVEQNQLLSDGRVNGLGDIGL
jgi:hypothetical protein